MFGWFRRKETINQTWRWAAVVAFAGMIAVNIIAATTTWLGGLNTGEVSDAHPNLFAPAGYTFSIWSAIYLLLILFLVRSWQVWQAATPTLPIKDHNYVLKLFTATSLINAAWMFAWQYQVFWLSVILMIALLVALAEIHRIVASARLSLSEVLAVRAPFSIYFGWVTVALIANVTTWLVSVNWDGWGVSGLTWMITMLLVGAIVLIGVGAYRRDWLYTAVGVWAYIGILVEHMTPDGHAARYGDVIMTLAVVIPMIAAATIAIGVWRINASQSLVDRLIARWLPWK